MNGRNRKSISISDRLSRLPMRYGYLTFVQTRESKSLIRNNPKNLAISTVVMHVFAWNSYVYLLSTIVVKTTPSSIFIDCREWRTRTVG